MLAEEIRVEIKAVADKAIREMKQFQNETKKTTGTSEKMGKTLGDVKVRTLAVAGAIGGAVAIFKKVAQTAQVWINAASDAEEISSKFAVTFDEMSVSAESAARELADSYGLAESTAKDLLSATGDMLGGFGATDAQALDLSTRVQKLAVDLASFTNYSGGAKGAADALTKGLLGEREMMKSLGIAIQEADVKQRILEKGQQELEGTAMKMARAEATLELAYEQSGNALGDYERTQDSYANVARRSEEVTKELREELGKRLIPAAGTLQGAILSVKEEMLEMVTATNDVNEAQEKLAKGLELDLTEALALANEEAIKTTNNLFLLSQGKFSAESLKDLWKVITGGKEAVDEMVDSNKMNEAIIKRSFGLQEAYEKKAQEIAQAAKDKATAEEKVTEELEKQRAIAEDYYEAGLDLAKQTIDDNKTDLEITREKLEHLKTLVWKEHEGVEAKRALRDEAIKLLEIEEQHLLAVNEVGQSYEGWRASMDNAQVAAKALEDRVFTGNEKIIEQNEKVIEQEKKKLSTLEGAQLLYQSLGSTVDALFEMQLEGLDKESAKYKQIKQEQAAAAKATGLFEASINTATAITRALTAGGIAGPILAAVIATLGAVQIAAIAAKPVPTFATGGDFITSGPQSIMVGDNPGGRERVSVTPLSSPNINGPGGGMNIFIQSPVYGVDDFYQKLTAVGDKLERRGRL